MTNFPKHLYLQSNIKPTQKTTVRQDSRIQGTSAGPTQRPNYAIPLLDWINERIRENDIILPETNCNCPEPECNVPIAVETITKFEDNGQSFQFIDIFKNCVFDPHSFTSPEIYVNDSLPNAIFEGDIELVYTPFYIYPLVKLSKPASSTNVNNIDVEVEFLFKFSDKCGESNPAKVTVHTVWYSLDDFINYNILT